MRIPSKAQLDEIARDSQKYKLDPHAELARWIWQLPSGECVSPNQRRIAKRVRQAVYYNAPAAMIARLIRTDRFANGSPGPTWKRRNSEEIPISGMSSEHIYNAIKMIRRREADLLAELAKRTGGVGTDDVDDCDPRDDFSPGVWSGDD